MRHKKIKQLLTKTLLGVLAAGLFGASTASALAPTASVIPESDQDAKTVNDTYNGTSSIKIVKYKQDANNGSEEGNGSSTAPPPSGETLDDIEFTLKKLGAIGETNITNLDYTKNETWEFLSKLVQGGVPTGKIGYDNTFAPVKVKTDSQGQAVFNNLKFGLYEVSETSSGKHKGVTPAKTTYLTLPLGTKENPSKWEYNPVLYPKNSIDEIVKTIDDSKANGVGDQVTYTLNTTINKYDGASPKKYVITDQLPAVVKYSATKVAFKISTTPLAKSTDYSLTIENNKVVVTFTTAGLEKMGAALAANPAEGVVTAITGVIQAPSKVSDDGSYTNTAYFVPNDSPAYETGGSTPPEGGTTPPPGIPSNGVDLKMYQLKLKKVDAGDESKLLAGAKFSVYASENDALSGTNPIKVLDESGKEVTEVTTGSNGEAVFKYLKASNFANGAPLETPNAYWVVENTAPNGYQLLSAPVKVVLGADAQVQTVKNVESNLGFKLPLTGSIAMLVCLVTGGLLVVGTGIKMARNKQ